MVYEMRALCPFKSTHPPASRACFAPGQGSGGPRPPPADIARPVSHAWCRSTPGSQLDPPPSMEVAARKPLVRLSLGIASGWGLVAVPSGLVGQEGCKSVVAVVDPSAVGESVVSVFEDGVELGSLSAAGGVAALPGLLELVAECFVVDVWRVEVNGFQRLVLGDSAVAAVCARLGVCLEPVVVAGSSR